MKRNLMVLLFLGVLGAVLVPGAVLAAIGPHDVTNTTGSLEGTCGDCHNTSATAATRGWGRSLSGAPAIGWGTRTITALCWSCHAAANPTGAHDVTGTAMATGSHAYVNSAVPPQPTNGNFLDNAAVIASGLPYASGDLQCTSCHNVHNAANRPFNIKTSVRTLCNSCHTGRDRATVGTLNTGGTPAYSTHPVGVTVLNIAGNGATGFIPTISDNLTTPYNAAPAYALGGKLEPTTNFISCETCHAVHGPRTGGAGLQDLLATNNQSEANVGSSYLCTGCHTGGFAGGYVGGGTAGDHPVDNNAGRTFYPAFSTASGLPAAWTTAAPRLDRGAAQFTNTIALLGKPRCSSCHDAHSGYATTSLLKGPSTPTGAAPVMTNAGGTGWCDSCHTLTEAVPNLHHSTTPVLATSLVNCGSCHSSGGTYWTAHNGFDGMIIGAENADGTAGSGGLGTGAPNSLTFERLCERCHNPQNPTVVAAGAGSLGLGTVGSTFASLVNVARHGVSTGSLSHLSSDLVAATTPIQDTNRTFNSYLRAGTVAADNSWGNTSANAGSYAGQAIYSKYANYGANTPTNPATLVNGAYLICESCHNLVLNAGTPSGATDKTGGYLANLLVMKYEDDGQGSGFTVSASHTSGVTISDSLCRGCHASAVIPAATLLTANVTPFTSIPLAAAFVHYPEAHTTNQSAFTYAINPYGRSGAGANAVQTVYNQANCATGLNTSTADAAGAPGLFTYPAANRMNCDSCHRPHNADAQATAGAALSNSNERYILEDGTVAADNLAKTQACTQCHNNRATTQWGCIQ